MIGRYALLPEKDVSAHLDRNRYLDIVQSTKLDTSTTKLAALSGENKLESYPTAVGDSYFPATSYETHCERYTPCNYGTLASIARSLGRNESRIDELYES